MTMPHQHNCIHNPDGWCLNCVEKLFNKQYENTNKDLIPKGDYCYAHDRRDGFVKCPFWRIRDFDDAEIPWCDYLGRGGLPNKTENYKGWEDPDLAEEKLKNYFGDKYEEKTDLFLLFDKCKECGENICIDENNPF